MKISSLLTSGRRKLIILSLPSPPLGTQSLRKQETSFCPLPSKSPGIQKWHTLCHQSLRARSEWTLPPNYSFSNTQLVNACICIPVKLHQVYFLILSLETVDCRCLYHVYFIDNRSSKHFRFVLFTFNFNMQTWTELEFFAARSTTSLQKALSTFSVV